MTVTNSWIVKITLTDYLKKCNLNKASDACFNAYDHGFVIATCAYATIQQFTNQRHVYRHHKKLQLKPLNLEATYGALMQFKLYAQKKNRVTKHEESFFIAGFFAAYYLFK